MAESVVERLIHLIKELTAYKYDLQTKESFNAAFAALLRIIFKKNFDAKLTADYKKEYRDYLLTVTIDDLMEETLSFSDEIQKQPPEKLEYLLSLIDENQNHEKQKLQIHRECPITLEARPLNEVCVAQIGNVIWFYDAEALLESFQDKLKIAKMDEDIRCPLNNQFKNIKFLSVKELIALLQANSPKTLEKIPQIKC